MLTTARNAERTRGRLLAAAFKEVHRSGFRAADVDAILAEAEVTKGALYYHFTNKEALGYALVDEVITAITRDKWLLPLQTAENPIDALINVVASTSLLPEHVCCGCPLNNLAQEMSPLDEGFRNRLAKVFHDWQSGIATALRKGQKQGFVRKDLDPQEAATFLMAVYQGYISMAKNSQDPRLLQSGTRSIVRYVESLRVVHRTKRKRKS